MNAAGAWSPEIGKMLGLIIPVKAQRGHLLITEPDSINRRWRYITGIDYLITAFNEEAVRKSQDPRIKLGVSASYVQASTGNWLIGSSRDFAGDNQINLQTIKYISATAIEFMTCRRGSCLWQPFCQVCSFPVYI